MGRSYNVFSFIAFRNIHSVVYHCNIMLLSMEEMIKNGNLIFIFSNRGDGFEHHGDTFDNSCQSFTFQLSPLKTVTVSQLKSRWMGLALLSNQLERILKKGDFTDMETLKWMDFLSFTCYNIAEVTYFAWMR